MEPTIPQEGGEESGSRRKTGRRRRRSPTPPMSSTGLAATQSESPRRGKWKRSRHSKKRARATAADTAAATAAASGSVVSEHASSSGVSSAVSSPIRWPLLCRTVIGEDASGRKVFEPFIKMDPKLVDAYDELTSKYHEKRGRQLKLVTLHQHESQSCMLKQELVPTRESATKTVLKAAKGVMGLSSYVDGRLLKQTTGFLIDWNSESKVGTLLTSALLIRSKSPPVDEWIGAGEYIPEAEVHVHLLDRDDTIVAAELLHYDKNYNLALFKVGISVSAEVLSFGSELKFGQEVFMLGRDKDLYLNIGHGHVQYVGSNSYERHHYMFLNCGLSECGLGGPVIDLNGEVTGMVNSQRTGFIPSSTILKCLHMWKKFNCIPRLHIGVKFSAIKFLDPIQIEAIYRKCNIDEGLIVQHVSEGSSAERQGIRTGDILQCCNGVYMSTTVENLLLEICEEHLDKGNQIDSNVEVQAGIFHTRSGLNCTKNLAVKVSDSIEVVTRGVVHVGT
ncbi:unnamed protein product [Urochloa decumbens]|uniref:PDZ domain-containing protein n=1 Tax=Urochloa decumbens TaxID=240449 RepID=A0ABC9H1D4_9POAL